MNADKIKYSPGFLEFKLPVRPKQLNGDLLDFVGIKIQLSFQIIMLSIPLGQHVTKFIAHLEIVFTDVLSFQVINDGTAATYILFPFLLYAPTTNNIGGIRFF